MDISNYPLAQLMKIKDKRFEQALKIVEEKTAILKREEQVLFKLEDEKNQVLKHKDEKLAQLREALDSGESTDKIRQMKTYLDVVKEKLKEKEKKVNDQKKNVIEAQNQLDIAKKNLLARKKDVEKLQIHKKEWEKEFKFWANKQEEIEQDELGSIRHVIKKKEIKKSQNS
ncbi:MAG: type III secretion T3S chaperone [Chlamydiae bacterium]|nr:type III secretion T3S chaperone [Chlamydiota bacterium]